MIYVNVQCSVEGSEIPPIEGVDWVVSISHYILLKFFNFIACYGAVILSFNTGKLLFHCITIPYGELYKLFILAVWIFVANI